LVRGTKAIYVYGIITYEDAFGESHTTNYRFMQNGKTTTVGQDITMTICEEGNEANGTQKKWKKFFKKMLWFVK
jgi:hypothetical protein